jgi:hypothetical protein
MPSGGPRKAIVALVAVLALAAVGTVLLLRGGDGDNADEGTGGASATTGAPAVGETTTTSPPARLQLQASGLGLVAFGSTYDAAIGVLVEQLGPPVDDSLELPFEAGCVTDVAACRALAPECGNAAVVRVVLWPGFTVRFYGPAAAPLLSGWSSYLADDAEPPVATAEGLRVTDPLVRWREVYRGAFSTTLFQSGDEGDPWLDAIELRLPDGVIRGITDLGAPPETISQLDAGVDCSGGDI